MDIDKFESPGWILGITRDEMIEQVVFTFESDKVGYNDVIYIDDINFRDS